MAVTPAILPSQTTRLGCGRDVDDVWDSIDQPPNEHEQTCPYCTQTRTELAALAAATNELRTADQDNEALRVPDRMLANVLAIVHTEVRRGRTIPLQRRVPAASVPVASAAEPQQPTAHQHGVDTETVPPGVASEVDVSDLTVSELVIATVVRETCDRNPDVEVRRVRIEVSPGSTTPIQMSGNSKDIRPARPQPGAVVPADVTMDLQATVSHTAAIPTLIAGLRTAIQQDVTARIGISVSRINVEVQDLRDV